MSKILEKSATLRAIVTPHYNCAQSVVMPFAEDAGISVETARRIGANFGGGMKRGSVCGAVTGGLMALGLFGLDDAETVETYYERLNAHKSLDCAELLKQNEEEGGEKKPFCDGMVFECVELVEAILKEKGRL
ncbi:MAG: C_GCAxxG_C_C family protein [Clostridia bacterium]|nr:C_GCAxxG_C_C family protein [Clostridia bacterium]